MAKGGGNVGTIKGVRERARTIAIVAGFVGGLGWIGKIIVMATKGGPDPDSGPEAIAFFVGLVGVGVAAAAAGTYLARGRSSIQRILAAAGGLVAMGLVIAAAQAGLPALLGDGWVQEEAIFGALGLFAISAATVALRSPGNGQLESGEHESELRRAA
jgi:hypothetical protein